MFEFFSSILDDFEAVFSSFGRIGGPPICSACHFGPKNLCFSYAELEAQGQSRRTAYNPPKNGSDHRRTHLRYRQTFD